MTLQEWYEENPRAMVDGKQVKLTHGVGIETLKIC